MRRELMVPVSLFLVMVTAIPLFGQLPAGWTTGGVGSPTVAGSVHYDATSETWTIRGAGSGIRGTADQFQYVYKTLTGDGELTARVVSLEPPLADWSMAGVMIRVLLAPGSPYLFMGVSANTETKDHGITFWGREAFDGVADQVSTGATGAPHWVKVRRTGSIFAALSSADGREWTERYSTSVAGIPNTIYIGYAVTSEVSGELVTAVFDRGPTTAWNPDPADGARNVAAPLFAWTAGINAASHKVYFGTSPALGAEDFKVEYPAEVAMYFHVPGLVPGMRYFWRVDEVAADGTTIYPGDVWSFTAAPATAYGPQPWDGLDGVGLETDLAWTAGASALSHDVYFGTDRAGVRAGDQGAFKGNRPTTAYDPGTLADNTAYYWRIDEHDRAGVVHPGLVWSFTTMRTGGVKAQYFSGIALLGTPVATGIENEIDHDWGSGAVAGGVSDSVSARWIADLEAPLTGTYQLITTSDDGVRLWLDDRQIIDNWANHGSTDDVATVRLVAGQFYRVQMEWYDNSGSAVARLSWQGPSIARQVIPAGILQSPVHATQPYPASEAEDTIQTPALTWIAAGAATHHDVYFGDDREAVVAADTASDVYKGRQTADATAFDPGPLEWGKTYFWRVDEVNLADAGSPWQGSLWSFTTADFLVIDDFEIYTDTEGNRIYESWIDGWTNDTGSQVGYLDAPFAEQTLVHGGRQSMPLDYNNAEAPYYSEAEREYVTTQDWTVNGADTLVLYVRGKASNDAAPLYVRLEDSAKKTAIIRHPDAAIASTAQWTQWNIPLGEFTAAGVNVTRVKRICLGLGDKAQPTPGGRGLIFIDDVRVIKP